MCQHQKLTPRSGIFLVGDGVFTNRFKDVANTYFQKMRVRDPAQPERSASIARILYGKRFLKR